MTRIYVSDVSQVPEGYQAKTGKKGGIYYEAEQDAANEDFRQKEGNYSEEQFLFTPQVKIEKDVIGSVIQSIDQKFYKITDIYMADATWTKNDNPVPCVELMDVYGATSLVTKEGLPGFIPNNVPTYYQLNAKIEEELNKLQGQVPWSENTFIGAINRIVDQIEESGNEMTDEMREEIKRIDKGLYEAKLDDGSPLYSTSERLQSFTTALADRRTLFGEARLKLYDTLRKGPLEGSLGYVNEPWKAAYGKEYEASKKMIGIVMQTTDNRVIEATMRGALVFREWTSNNFDQVAPLVSKAIREQIENSRPGYVVRSDAEDEYDALVMEYATKKNLLAFKAFSSKIASLAYGDSIGVYRGLSVAETVAQLPDIWEGKSTKVKGTLYSFSDEVKVAQSFADVGGSVVYTNIGTDNVWGGWWVASPRHDAGEREVICDVPQEGLSTENRLSRIVNASYKQSEMTSGQSLVETFRMKILHSVEMWQENQKYTNPILETIMGMDQDGIGGQMGELLHKATKDIVDGVETPESILKDAEEQVTKGRSVKWLYDRLMQIQFYHHNLSACKDMMELFRDGSSTTNEPMKAGLIKGIETMERALGPYKAVDIKAELTRIQNKVFSPEALKEQERLKNVTEQFFPDIEEEKPFNPLTEEPANAMSEWSSSDDLDEEDL